MIICELRSLVQLNLSCNKIPEIPPEIKQLKQLEVLWCNNTELQIIPDEICSCIALETFGARGNKIHQLPENFGELKKLRLLFQKYFYQLNNI